MTCYHPLKAYRSKRPGASGKHSIVWQEKHSNGESLYLPCGQCTWCRLQKSAVWATRISCEASLYEKNCFITLTYAPEHLPEGGTLVVSHYQDFMKRLKSRISYTLGKQAAKNIRFFQCGEYGELNGRPHYHACLLNFDFPDKVFAYTTDRGDHVFTSKLLDSIWGMGRCEIGSVTFESAAYVARYIMKKFTGPDADDYYSGRIPEYINMSRKPGIGAPWLDRYHPDVYSYDYLIIRGGIKVPPPRYFDKRYELIDPVRFDKIKVNRAVRGYDFDPDKLVFVASADLQRKQLDNTYERRIVKETVHLATVNSTLKRRI